ncbi:MAG: Smr/MutS family protein [Rhodospirillales bacterium]|nr:Smr/MutS family protein [Rhodospirillales bacterium]
MSSDKKKPPASGPLADEDLDLWRHVTREAKPLPGREKPKRKAEQPAKAEEAKRPKPPPPRRPEQPAPPAAPALRPGAQADVDKRTAERLKRGKLAIEGRLDLHGHSQEQAEQELAAFLAEAQAAGKRCVLVITGKGAGRTGGVLRQSLPDWLNRPPNRARVVAFAPAQPKDGGHGAVYLLLRRRRA